MKQNRLLVLLAGLALALLPIIGCSGGGGAAKEPYADDSGKFVLREVTNPNDPDPFTLTAEGTFNEEGSLIADATDQNNEIRYRIIASPMKLEPSKFLIQVMPKVLNVGYYKFYLEAEIDDGRSSKGSLVFKDTESRDGNGQLTGRKFSITAEIW